MKCPNCGAEVKEGDTFCGECGGTISQKRAETSPSVRKEGFFSRPVPEGKVMTYLTIGIICAIVSLLFLPPVFGGAAIVLGYVVWKNGPEGKRDYGMGLLVVGIVCMIVGFMFGWLTYMY